MQQEQHNYLRDKRTQKQPKHKRRTKTQQKQNLDNRTQNTELTQELKIEMPTQSSQNALPSSPATVPKFGARR